MKRRYDDGGEILEALNSSDEAMEIAESVGAGPKNTDIPKSKPKSASKAKPKPAAKSEPKLIDSANIRSGRREFEESQMPSSDKTKMSVSERAKANRERARSGSGSTDRRSVNERLKSAFGMKSGGSASSRGDGIASRGKTRGKMC